MKPGVKKRNSGEHESVNSIKPLKGAAERMAGEDPPTFSVTR
jgi:hypothetical protein